MLNNIWLIKELQILWPAALLVLNSVEGWSSWFQDYLFSSHAQIFIFSFRVKKIV